MEKLRMEIGELMSIQKRLMDALILEIDIKREQRTDGAILVLQGVNDVFIRTIGEMFRMSGWLIEDYPSYCNLISSSIAYDDFERVFMEEFGDGERNRGICRVMKQYIKDHLEGLGEIAKKYEGEPDKMKMVGETREFRFNLSRRLFEELGVYIGEEYIPHQFR